MRKEDLKKRSKEEKTVSAAEQILINTILISLFLFSNLSAQIPINGFCRYREITVKPNFTNIFSIDYNSDGYRDLVIYNPAVNKYLALTADQKSNFKNVSEKFLPVIINDVHPFGREKTGRKFLFLSRKTRQVGIAAVSKYGSISISSKIKFAGYPSKIDVGDIDGDGMPEGLVSGKSLNGLYVLKEKNHTLKETRVVDGKVFSASSFIDLDYDSFPDIAAVDMFTNSIILYYNNQLGSFIESRSIGLNGEITGFSAADFNSDGFTDLVYVKDNHFEVLLGDSVSSFRKKIILETPVKPDKYTILDFNGDGYNDIAYINTKLGELYISFGQGTNSFYPPILYLKKNNLTDVTAYIDRTGKKLAALSSDGKVYFINALKIDDDSFSLSIGQKPSALQTFDYLNDKFKDICFIDENAQSLNLLLSERRNLFRTYFTIPLSSNFTEIAVDDTKERNKTFYCYSKGNRILEIVRMNFDNQKYSKKILYADGPIEDIKLTSDRLKDRQTIFVLVNKNSKLYLQSFEFRDFHYVSTDMDLINSNCESAWLQFGVYKEIYCVSRNNNQIELSKTVFDKKIIETRTLFDFKLSPKDFFSYDLICIDELIDRAKPVAVLISQNKNSYLYIISNNRIKKYPIKSLITKNVMLRYNLDESGEELTFYFNDNVKKKIRSFTFHGTNKLPIENDLFESKNFNNYLVTNLSSRKTFLIYLNNSQNTLTFEKI